VEKHRILLVECCKQQSISICWVRDLLGKGVSGLDCGAHDSSLGFVDADTGEAVAEAPFPLRVVAATPDPRKSVVKPQPTGSALVGREIGFEVEARDKHGNK
jgi:hypothetical protein